MTSPHRALYVAWQSQLSRAIYPIGQLVDRKEAPRFEFAYIQGAQEAANDGFEKLLDFPDHSRLYHSDHLFPLFNNRLMQATRSDYEEHLVRPE